MFDLEVKQSMSDADGNPLYRGDMVIIIATNETGQIVRFTARGAVLDNRRTYDSRELSK